jgi:cathepsin L
MSASIALASMCTLPIFGIAVTVSSDVLATDATGVLSFDDYISEYGRTFSKGSQEYEERAAIFDRNLGLVELHNTNPKRRWNAVVNHLSDRTEPELQQLRGLRAVKASRRSTRASPHGSARMGAFLAQTRDVSVPDEKLWTHLRTAVRDTNQLSCGSCWAVATANMLSINAEIQGLNQTYSPQELVNCVPNPHNCGGSGGCDGATVELAMNWVTSNGLASEGQVPYHASNGQCAKKGPALIDGHGDADKLGEMIAIGVHHAEPQSAGAQMGLTGWERLPENEYEPLIRAIALTGPAAVSVSADSWGSYGSGLFDGCSPNAVIDHGVTLVGYGIDKTRNEKYWTIKNSWGNGWGEQGNIRLLRQEGKVHCGIDRQPKLGTACDHGPSQVDVCGMCGILYDAVVPFFRKQ